MSNWWAEETYRGKQQEQSTRAVCRLHNLTRLNNITVKAIHPSWQVGKGPILVCPMVVNMGIARSCQTSANYVINTLISWHLRSHYVVYSIHLLYSVWVSTFSYPIYAVLLRSFRRFNNTFCKLIYHLIKWQAYLISCVAIDLRVIICQTN